MNLVSKLSRFIPLDFNKLDQAGHGPIEALGILDGIPHLCFVQIFPVRSDFSVNICCLPIYGVDTLVAGY